MKASAKQINSVRDVTVARFPLQAILEADFRRCQHKKLDIKAFL